MIKRFFEILPDGEVVERNRQLFHGFQVEKCASIINNHFEKYPDIFLDLRSLGSVCSHNDALHYLVLSCVHGVYERHSYLYTSDKLIASEKKDVKEWCGTCLFRTEAISQVEIYDDLINFAEYLVKHFNKEVFVLVDKYDGICTDSIIYIEDKENMKVEDEIMKIMLYLRVAFHAF